MARLDKDALPLNVSFRKIWPYESELFKDHLLRLDDQTRHSRFGIGVSNEFLQSYAKTAFQLNTVIFGCFIGETLRATAELRPLLESSPHAAEAAFSVEPPWQDSGIGTKLMRRTVKSARNRGFSTLYMICLSDNKRMQRIAKKHSANLHFEEGDIEGKIDPSTPTPISVAEEMAEDVQEFVTAIFSWPR